MIRTFTGTITATGSAGTATGSADIGPIRGRLISVGLTYSGLPALTTDVTLATKDGSQTVLTRTNSTTNGVYYPRIQMQDTTGTAVAGVYEPLKTDGYLTLAIAQGDPAGTVAYVVKVEEYE